MLDYYTLKETLKMLTESSNDKYTYTAKDIATLCRQSILTPVFAYSNDCMEILEYYDGSKPLISKNGGETEYDTSRAPEPMTTHFHDGYLTDKRLLSLLDESQNKLELFSVMTYESDGSGCEIALVTNGGYTITRESLLLPSEQVQNYIASKQTAEQNTPEQQLIAELEREIADIKKQLEQVRAKLTNKPADDLKDIPYQTYKTLDKVMYAMAKITNLDNSKPYSQNTPSLNAAITTILQNAGLPLEYEAVGKWLSRINDIKPLK